MSAEEGSAQPSAAGNDKAPAPKAAATFSSFINKNTTGKKFAPKAVARRRPGAAAAAAAPAAPVPPPAATQEPEYPTASQSISRIHESSIATEELGHVHEPSPIATEPLPTPPSTIADTQPRQEQETQIDTQTSLGAVHTAEDGLETGRAPKRRRVDLPASKDPATTQVSVNEGEDQSPTQPMQQEQDDSTQQLPQDQESISTEALATATEMSGLAAETTAPQPRPRRTLPWATVNPPQDDDNEEAVAPAPTKRRLARTRGKKKVTVDEDAGEAEQQEVDEENDSQTVRKRPTAKARGKRKAVTASAEDGGETQPPLKRPRRLRKAKAAEGTGTAEAADEEAEPEEDGGEEVVLPRKPRQPKRKKRQTTEGEGENGEGAQPKRKGRPPREPTPEDAEEQIIDPQITFMDGLASRNIRVGKLSSREKQMREIDWAAVKQRRQEEDARPIKSKEEQEAADTALNAAALNAPQDLGPRFQTVDGVIQLVPNTGTVDREADADREIADYEIIEDRDITSRITSRSFMKNNKRFPNDFILPGQGRRWNTESTDLFYQGLKSFGTDFQMVSQMFPGSTRRSIKTKFTREERENPERVREALQGQSEIASHWGVFLEASQRQEESFADADEIKRQLAEDEARMRALITAAAEETRQRNLQKAAAGVLDDENGDGENANKENGKGKKKRGQKGKQVTFQEEQGVEIIGSLEDDPTWGQ
ncbi:uncharacterized protein K460DRAFT_269753 [Cucurbitaria berberidis CBS 394.84]|uniref:Transcription factor TFIIIB component B'' Myb domain-containing protein n=1 Tax=Cucurbitaria berberidis CBS 394.84 TaxID=1168544 RepID=A0A9P4GTD0_9PLEO|nr:uncharacterized protein K460DRAFT_269753 [Cucurbitaria berberidis CBS 394.84]KAF1851131.1 hypothetical protein K460DRAFT_269753 [Cucurbitaria berberidis CBS 394.84]